MEPFSPNTLNFITSGELSRMLRTLESCENKTMTSILESSVFRIATVKFMVVCYFGFNQSLHHPTTNPTFINTIL
jgi:hypothetical protein